MTSELRIVNHLDFSEGDAKGRFTFDHYDELGDLYKEVSEFKFDLTLWFNKPKPVEIEVKSFDDLVEEILSEGAEVEDTPLVWSKQCDPDSWSDGDIPSIGMGAISCDDDKSESKSSGTRHESADCNGTGVSSIRTDSPDGVVLVNGIPFNEWVSNMQQQKGTACDGEEP